MLPYDKGDNKTNLFIRQLGFYCFKCYESVTMLGVSVYYPLNLKEVL